MSEEYLVSDEDEEDEAERAKRERAERKKKRREKRAKEKDRDKKSAPSESNIDVVELEIKELDTIRPDESESTLLFDDEYENIFPNDVYSSFSRLQGFARDLNTRLNFPEYVLVGPTGSGKSSLLEALLGDPLVGVQATQRPVLFSFVNNPACAEPRYTLKRDPVIREFDHDAVVEPSKLSRRIAQRQIAPDSDLGVVVVIECRSFLNFTLIDTPGLEKGDRRSEELVLRLANPSHRRIIFVVEATNYENPRCVDVLKKVDPELNRTTFVYTKFVEQLRNFPDTASVNRYFQQTSALNSEAFHVTTLSHGLVERYEETSPFRKKVWQLQRRDLRILESLRFDRTFEPHTGLHNFRRHLLTAAWKSFQEDVPAILHTLRRKKANMEQQLSEIRDSLERLDVNKLRHTANAYCVEFLQIVESLVTGSSEGNPNVTGQTLPEEDADLGLGHWKDVFNAVLVLDTEAVPYHDARVYGGQQLKRLFGVFAEVAKSITIEEPSLDVIGTAAGVSKLNNVPNYAWAACELAQQEVRKSLQPLIKQLAARAAYIAGRLPAIAAHIMQNRRKTTWKASPELLETDVEQYPFFAHAVVDIYTKFVEEQRDICTEKSRDEFFDTRTVYWHLAEDAKEIPVERDLDEDAEEAVFKIARTIFAMLRDRIVENVQLKFYNFFVVPLQTTLVSRVQEDMSKLTPADLEERFEMASTKAKLSDEEKLIADMLGEFRELESSLLDNATRFAHPSLSK